MNHVFKCIWGSIELNIESDGSWFVSIFGDCPRNIKNNIEKLKKNRPKPDSVMAFFFIKNACGKTLLYTK